MVPHLEPHGRNRYRLRARDPATGRQFTLSTHTGRRAAQSALEAAQALGTPLPTGALAGLVLPGQLLSWADLITRYCTSRRSAGRTEAHIDNARRTLLALGESRGWATSSCPTPASAEGLGSHAARHLRALLRYAHEHLDQPIHPRILALARPRTPRRVPHTLLTADQVATLIAEAGRWHPADGCIAHLIATYGHRAETAIAIRRGDYLPGQSPQLDLRVKSGDRIRHPILPETAARLDAIISTLNVEGSTTPVILSGHLGRPWRSGSEYSAWWGHAIAGPARRRDPAIPSAGILDLRRYAITTMFGLGLDPRTIASITGHRTPSLLLNTYARTSEARQAHAISALSTLNNLACPSLLPPSAPTEKS